jgi:hypothetical protein
MTTRKSLLIYLVLFAVVSGVTGLTYRLTDWAAAVAACKLYREPGTFLAYCTSDRYGFYEQGAYWFDLEPEAIEHLKKAQVLFLGNSRAQFGFSTDKLRDYFHQHGIPFYAMGFSYGEASYFARALIEKYHLTPKVLVIDADPFFSTGYTDAINAAFDESGSVLTRSLRWVKVRWDFVTKHYFNVLQPGLCRLLPRLCTSEFKSVYRSEDDGTWIWRDVYAPAEANSIPNEPKKYVIGVDIAVDLQYVAKEFMKRVNVPPECVILTQVPNSVHEAKTYVDKMGEIIQVPVVFPVLPGLSTIDTSHLTWSSAQRWSEAFLNDADPIITRCVSPQGRAAAGG